MNPSFSPTATWSGVVAQLRVHIAAQGWHAARTVVLVPYAQLMGVARAHWTDACASGFTPRFETTRSWARATAGFLASGDDLQFDRACDLVTAQSLLARAGLGRERHALAGRLLDLALQLAPLAAAQPPALRAEWAVRAGTAVQDDAASEWFRTEALLASVAIAWVAHAAYATDVLLEATTRAQADGLVLLQGLSADPLLETLQSQWAGRALVFSLLPPALPVGEAVCLHAARDAEDEAERALACVLRHVEQGRTPVALVATDRVLTRRIGAQLAAHGVAQQDETGWKLSTTRAAAALMTALVACGRHAGSDEVLDWLKHAPAAPPTLVDALEARLRREGLHDWTQASGWIAAQTAPQATPRDAALVAFAATIAGWRAPLASPRPLGEWLQALRTLLQQGGQWDGLRTDAAGAEVLRALWLEDEPGFETARLTLADFSQWVREVLEAASFVPPGDGRAPQVVVLPLHQLLGRSFGAVVLPGCDERRLPAMPEPPGPWTPAQRALLGLPAREALAAAQRTAFALAAASPACELLMRENEGGEPLRASPLVQLLQLDAGLAVGTDPRIERLVPAAPVAAPLPTAARLPLQSLSASVYEDLRRCPYRFFALRLLGLRDAEEISDEVDKRQFGNWVHEVLRRFHEAARDTPPTDNAQRSLLLASAESATRAALGLDAAGFLPFAAAWPAMRAGYLTWLDGHQAQGHAFVEAEPAKERRVPDLPLLVGRIDRIDQGAGGTLVLDYKTESPERTRERIKDPTEDTQLAFYAALLDAEPLRAAYLNVGEKGVTALFEQPALQEARDGLLAGIHDDLGRIAAGAALPALGEGTVCDHCSARGLCRKDFWSVAHG